MERTRFPAIAVIYKIISKTSKKFYIGSTVNFKKRRKWHIRDLQNQKHGNIYLQRHANKYGITSLLFKIIETCLKEKLIEREQHYIDTLKPDFNICKIAGSTLGITYSEKAKHNLRVAQRKRFEKPEEHLKLIKAFKSRLPDTEETRKKKSKAVSGQNNPMYGKHHTKESIRKNRESNIGIQAGEKNGMFGRKHNEKAVQKMRDVNIERKQPQSQINKRKQTIKNKPIITCPVCGYEGKFMKVMLKNHFDNCKILNLKR